MNVESFLEHLFIVPDDGGIEIPDRPGWEEYRNHRSLGVTFVLRERPDGVPWGQHPLDLDFEEHWPAHVAAMMTLLSLREYWSDDYVEGREISDSDELIHCMAQDIEQVVSYLQKFSSNLQGLLKTEEQMEQGIRKAEASARKAKRELAMAQEKKAGWENALSLRKRLSASPLETLAEEGDPEKIAS